MRFYQGDIGRFRNTWGLGVAGLGYEIQASVGSGLGISGEGGERV